jgi:hypothetical protein
MSAALKQKASEPTSTPFPSAERAALAHAIAAAADARARRVALEQAAQAANTAVLAAIGAAEAAEAALAEAGPLAVKHTVDKALGKAGPPPMSTAQARAAVIQCQDHLDECRAARAALKAELDRGDNPVPALRLTDAARAVIRSEMRQRAAALAEEVARLQKDLVSKGSALSWLHSAGVFPTVERGQDDPVGRTVSRMESTPNAWTISNVRGGASFAVPTGGNAWKAAFEQLLRDANTPLPVELA